jgi:rare lipoprotein A
MRTATLPVAFALLVTLVTTACSRATIEDAVQHNEQLSSPILETAEGLASYYARMLDGRLTASGIKLDLTEMIAAHPTYPFGTTVRVTNVENQHSVEVRIIDRGPASGPRKEGVIIDLSRAAAARLGLFDDGRVPVILEVLRWGEDAAPSRTGD